MLFFRDLAAARPDLERDFDQEDLLTIFGGKDTFTFRYVPEDERKGAPITPHYSKANPQPAPATEPGPRTGDELAAGAAADDMPAGPDGQAIPPAEAASNGDTIAELRVSND